MVAKETIRNLFGRDRGGSPARSSLAPAPRNNAPHVQRNDSRTPQISGTGREKNPEFDTSSLKSEEDGSLDYAQAPVSSLAILREKRQLISFEEEVLSGQIPTSICVVGNGNLRGYMETSEAFKLLRSSLESIARRKKVLRSIDFINVSPEFFAEKWPTSHPKLYLQELTLGNSEAPGYFRIDHTTFANPLLEFIDPEGVTSATILHSSVSGIANNTAHFYQYGNPISEFLASCTNLVDLEIALPLESLNHTFRTDHSTDTLVIGPEALNLLRCPHTSWNQLVLRGFDPRMYVEYFSTSPHPAHDLASATVLGAEWGYLHFHAKALSGKQPSLHKLIVFPFSTFEGKRRAAPGMFGQVRDDLTANGKQLRRCHTTNHLDDPEFLYRAFEMAPALRAKVVIVQGPESLEPHDESQRPGWLKALVKAARNFTFKLEFQEEAEVQKEFRSFEHFHLHPKVSSERRARDPDRLNNATFTEFRRELEYMPGLWLRDEALPEPRRTVLYDPAWEKRVDLALRHKRSASSFGEGSRRPTR